MRRLYKYFRTNRVRLNKLNSHRELVRFWNHAYDFSPNCTPLSSITIIINWFIRQRAFMEIWSTSEALKFGEHERRVRGYASSNSSFLSRWTHSWLMNQLFYNIFNPMVKCCKRVNILSATPQRVDNSF